MHPWDSLEMDQMDAHDPDWCDCTDCDRILKERLGAHNDAAPTPANRSGIERDGGQ